MSDAPWMRGLHADTGYLLYRLGLRSGSLFNAGLEQHSLRLRHYALLRYLSVVESARQRELSDRLGYDPSAIVSLVDDLQRLELAERRPDPNDRRNRIVVLTEAGRRLLRESEQDGARVTDELLAPLGAQERQTLHDLLLRIAEPAEPGEPAEPTERAEPSEPSEPSERSRSAARPGPSRPAAHAEPAAADGRRRR